MRRILVLVILVLLPTFLAAKDKQGGRKASKLVKLAKHEQTEEKRVIRSLGKLTESAVVAVRNNDDDDDEDDDGDGSDTSDGHDDDDDEGSGAKGSAEYEDSNGDDDDDDDNDDKGKEKKVLCKRRCAPPMTFDECANPRCAMKHTIVKELCYYLCKNQQIKCKETCEPE